MIVKEMKPFAKPIGADRHEMRRLSYGSAGAAFVNFADSIITKYTKVLNYQFPTASLTLLTQAEADRQAEHDRNRQVEVNWKLITYLVRNVHMSITQPLVWNQLRQNVRESIDRLELTDKKQAADMRQIYRRFQDTVREVIHGGIEARDAKETQLTAAAVLKDRLEKTTGYREILKFLDNIQTDNTDIIENTGTRDMRSTYRQDEKPEVVSIFSRAFFLNLNHLVNDNRLPDHREIWRVSNEQSQKDHSVKMWVDRMAGMTDPEKKLEILQTLVQKYGIRSVQRSINAMSSASFEKIKDSVKLYRYYVSGVSDDDTGIGAVGEPLRAIDLIEAIDD